MLVCPSPCCTHAQHATTLRVSAPCSRGGLDERQELVREAKVPDKVDPEDEVQAIGGHPGTVGDSNPGFLCKVKGRGAESKEEGGTKGWVWFRSIFWFI